MDPVRIFHRVKAVCRDMADLVNGQRQKGAQLVSPQEIPIKLDDDGTGGALGSFLREDGYSAVQVGAGCGADDPEKYPKKRDELWFRVAAKARAGLVYLGDLDGPTARRLKKQLLAPEWNLDASGRRKVEPKEDTKEKIGRSPDDADAFNLAHYDVVACGPRAIVPDVPQRPTRLFGR